MVTREKNRSRVLRCSLDLIAKYFNEYHCFASVIVIIIDEFDIVGETLSLKKIASADLFSTLKPVSFVTNYKLF